MFSQMLNTYLQSEALPGPVLFDRGIPDILGYAAPFGFAFPSGENAAHLYRYNPSGIRRSGLGEDILQG